MKNNDDNVLIRKLEGQKTKWVFKYWQIKYNSRYHFLFPFSFGFSLHVFNTKIHFILFLYFNCETGSCYVFLAVKDPV